MTNSIPVKQPKTVIQTNLLPTNKTETNNENQFITSYRQYSAANKCAIQLKRVAKIMGDSGLDETAEGNVLKTTAHKSSSTTGSDGIRFAAQLDAGQPTQRASLTTLTDCRRLPTSSRSSSTT